MIEDAFAKFIQTALATRELKIIKKKKLDVNLLPEIKKIFQKSMHVSSIFTFRWLNWYIAIKGRSHYLLRDANSDDSDADPATFTFNKGRKLKKENLKLMELIEDMKRSIDELKQANVQGVEDRAKLAQLFEWGIINDVGQPL